MGRGDGEVPPAVRGGGRDGGRGGGGPQRVLSLSAERRPVVRRAARVVTCGGHARAEHATALLEDGGELATKRVAGAEATDERVGVAAGERRLGARAGEKRRGTRLLKLIKLDFQPLYHLSSGFLQLY